MRYKAVIKMDNESQDRDMNVLLIVANWSFPIRFSDDWKTVTVECDDISLPRLLERRLENPVWGILSYQIFETKPGLTAEEPTQHVK